MSRFLESISIKNNVAENLTRHAARITETLVAHYGNSMDIPDLNALIKTHELNPEVKYKCRVIYDKKIQNIEYVPYASKEIQSLECMFDDDIIYNYKYTDRKRILQLSDGSGADDIIIVKKGRVTDSSYSNLAFLSEGKWYTPLYPLLRGIRRQKLIDEKILEPRDILFEQLHTFEKVRLFNAMLDWGEGPEVDAKNIICVNRVGGR